MAIDNKTLLIIGAMGIGAYIYLDKGSSGGFKFYVPGQGYVDEKYLPGLGYQKVNGMWYSPAQINNATTGAGYPSGTPVNETMQIFNDIMAILTTLIPLTISTVNLIVNSTNRNQVIETIWQKFTDWQSPDFIPMWWATKSDLQAMTNAELQNVLDDGLINGIYGIHNCSTHGKNLKVKNSSKAGRGLANCRWYPKLNNDKKVNYKPVTKKQANSRKKRMSDDENLANWLDTMA